MRVGETDETFLIILIKTIKRDKIFCFLFHLYPFNSIALLKAPINAKIDFFSLAIIAYMRKSINPIVNKRCKMCY